MAVIAPPTSSKAPTFTVVIQEKGGGERREVFEASELTVGRVQGNDIMLGKGNVSKRHARLLYRDGRFIVTDLNSTNGTYVNRRRIAQATIVREGDKIYVGDFVLRVEPSPSTENSGTHDSSAASARSTKPESTPSAAPDGPTPSVVPSELPGRPTAISFDAATPGPGRRTLADLGGETTALNELVGSLVAGVAERLPPGELRRTTEAVQRERVNTLLKEVWASLEREAAGLDGERILAAARAELLELGPLTELLADSTVQEIGVQRFDRITVQRNGRPPTVEPGFSSEVSLTLALFRLCEESGVPLTAEESLVERRLHEGASLQAVLGPASQSGSILVIRRPRRATLTLEELVRRGTISRAMATLLHSAVGARLNILIVGPRDGGAQALLGALALAPIEGGPIWICEASNPPFSGMSRLDAKLAPERLRRAVAVAAEVPGARLVADLATPSLASAVMDAVAAGADGVVAARTAPTLERGLSRLAAELVVASPLLTAVTTRDLVASSFDLLVEVAQLRDGRYRVLRVAELASGGEGGSISDIFSFVVDRTVAGGAIEGAFVPSGSVPRLAETLRARGTPLEAALFARPPSR